MEPTRLEYDLTHIVSPDNRNGIEYEKLRVDYAWRQFDRYGHQRLQMLYFFLISSAFLCGAIINLHASQSLSSTRATDMIAMTGAILSVVFLALEIRTHTLYAISRRHLRALETTVLFPDGFREVNESSQRLRGILVEDSTKLHLIRYMVILPA